MNIRLYGAVPDSIVDGPGLRYGVFVQGCTHHCPGCHNPESQPAEGGTLTTVDAVLDDICANGLIHDVTLSGGEPFEQAVACAELARRLKAEGYGIWAYTGYLYEDLLRIARAADAAAAVADSASIADVASDADPAAPASAPAPAHLDPQGVRDLLACVDVLVDGPFVESLKSLALKWCGSSNQRLIDLAAMRAAGDSDRVILWKPRSFVPEKPASW